MKTANETPSTSKQRSPLLTIFLTVFIDLVGFGIVIPLSPFLAREFHASAAEIGWLLAIYSITQFLFSPVWGGLSDRFGRRPILLISIAGGCLSYTLFAFASSFWLLFAARGLAGLFGGNISTAHAYIADVTSEKDRSKGMGLIGAAFGLGFIVGPILGGLLGYVGQRLGDHPPLGLSFSALGAAFLCLINLIFTYTSLKESLPAEKRAAANGVPLRRGSRLLELWRQLHRPTVGQLIFVYFLSGLAMAQMEAMLFPYVADVFNWDLRTASYGFAYVGVLMVLTQGVFIRRWMPRYGEPLILSVGLGLFSVSLFGVGASSTIPLLAVAMTILALGNGLMRPPNLGLISLLTPREQQGAALGVTNSTASLGRIIGPIIGGYLYQSVNRSAPFVFAGVLAALAFATIIFIYGKLPVKGRTETLNAGNVAHES